jgi:hypothetical protein
MSFLFSEKKSRLSQLVVLLWQDTSIKATFICIIIGKTGYSLTTVPAENSTKLTDWMTILAAEIN